MKISVIKKIIIIFLLFTTIIFLPFYSYAIDNYSFMNFSWNDSAETVKTKMEKNDFQIRRDYETANPSFMINEFPIPYISNYINRLSAINVKLPSNLLFKVYEGMGPTNSPAFYGAFCISNTLKKLVYFTIKVNSDHEDKIEQVLTGKYGTPSVVGGNYKMWEKGGEKLFLIINHEIIYLNEEHLNKAVSAMTSGIEGAKTKEGNQLNNIFVTQINNTLCFNDISWEIKADNFKNIIKKKNFFIRDPKKTIFNYFPFNEDKTLNDFQKKANPLFLTDKNIILEYSGFNEDKNVPVGGIVFHFSTRTQKLLYYTVEFERNLKEGIIETLDSIVGSGKQYALGKYWSKDNINIYNSSNCLLYLNIKNVSEHVSLIEKEGEKETGKQQQKMKEMF